MTIITPSSVGRRNDEIRQQGLFGPGQDSALMITPGVSALGPVAVDQLVVKLMQFDDWSVANDPHGDRDFGTLTLGDTRVFFKIDRHETDADARIITLLLPSEN